MHIHNLKFAWRTLIKNKVYSAINFLGLAVAIAACLLIYRMVAYERSFNTGFKDADRIARVVTDEQAPAGDEHTPGLPIPAMERIAASVPQFEKTARIREFWPAITVGDAGNGKPLKKFNTEFPVLSMFVEPTFFDVFRLKWLAGNPQTALTDINTGVLTRSWAEKLFDSWQNAPGKTILLDDRIPVTVQGVVEDFPDNCDLPLNLLVSYTTLKPNSDLYFYDEDWGATSSNNQMYVLLRDAALAPAADAVLAGIGQEEYARNRGARAGSKRHRLQPLADIHFNDQFGHSGTHTVTQTRLWVLTSIGFLILLMACFNFINLSTAMAVMRGKEVGVRKTLGGSRSRLMGQFMLETALLTALAAIAGAGLAAAIHPWLKHISDIPESLPFLSDFRVWAFLGMLTVAVSLGAGFYPALVLAGFNPVAALKSKFARSASGGVALRKGLVVFQFGIAQVLVLGAIAIITQLNFIRERDLGFKKDLIYTFNFGTDSNVVRLLPAFKQKLEQIPGVEAVTFCNDQPSSGNTWNSNFGLPASGSDADFDISLKFCDADFRKVYGLSLAAGRWLEPSDTMREVLVNETVLRKLGIADPQTVVGMPLRLGGLRPRTVVGVVRDFHSKSLHESLEPLLITTRTRFYDEAGVKITSANIPATTEAIRNIFDAFLPKQVFKGRFLDAYLEEFYQTEARFSNLCKAFALLAILISCLGLFGLASHAANSRVKEIGIRKVLGASVGGILSLLSRDFMALVLLAMLLSCPIAWMVMQRWLGDFAYRIDLHWWMFAATGACALGIAFLSVGFQSLKAALSNPVESLKSE